VHLAPTPAEVFATNGIHWGFINLYAAARGVVRRQVLTSAESTNDTTIALEAAKIVNPGLSELINREVALWVNYIAKLDLTGARGRVAPQDFQHSSLICFPERVAKAVMVLDRLTHLRLKHEEDLAILLSIARQNQWNQGAVFAKRIDAWQESLRSDESKRNAQSLRCLT